MYLFSIVAGMELHFWVPHLALCRVGTEHLKAFSRTWVEILIDLISFLGVFYSSSVCDRLRTESLIDGAWGFTLFLVVHEFLRSFFLCGLSWTIVFENIRSGLESDLWLTLRKSAELWNILGGLFTLGDLICGVCRLYNPGFGLRLRVGRGSGCLRRINGGVVADKSSRICLRNLNNGVTKSVSTLNLLCDMVGGSTK